MNELLLPPAQTGERQCYDGNRVVDTPPSNNRQQACLCRRCQRQPQHNSRSRRKVHCMRDRSKCTNTSLIVGIAVLKLAAGVWAVFWSVRVQRLLVKRPNRVALATLVSRVRVLYAVLLYHAAAHASINARLRVLCDATAVPHQHMCLDLARRVVSAWSWQTMPHHGHHATAESNAQVEVCSDRSHGRRLQLRRSLAQRCVAWCLADSNQSVGHSSLDDHVLPHPRHPLPPASHCCSTTHWYTPLCQRMTPHTSTNSDIAWLASPSPLGPCAQWVPRLLLSPQASYMKVYPYSQVASG